MIYFLIKDLGHIALLWANCLFKPANFCLLLQSAFFFKKRQCHDIHLLLYVSCVEYVSSFVHFTISTIIDRFSTISVKKYEILQNQNFRSPRFISSYIIFLLRSLDSIFSSNNFIICLYRQCDKTTVYNFEFTFFRAPG